MMVKGGLLVIGSAQRAHEALAPHILIWAGGV